MDHEGCFDEDVVELHERRLRDNEREGENQSGVDR